MKRDRVASDRLKWQDERCASMDAGIYIRKSTETEGRSKSRDRQLADCQRDAKSFGFRSVHVYLEEEGEKGEWWWDDHCGRNPEPYRAELTRLVDDIQKGKIQAVLVYKADRIIRDSGVSDGLAKLFRTYGVRFIANGRDTEISTARGMYQFAVDAAAARQWRDQISEDIIDDHAYKFERRMLTRNPSCFGFRSCGRESRALRPIYAELEIVRRIYRMFLGVDQAPLGPYQIARILMQEGVIISTGSKGHEVKDPKRVHGGSIRQILKNPMYAGLWQHNGEMAHYDQLLIVPEDGQGEPTTAIPEEWYYQAAAKFSSGQHLGTKGATDKRPLAGLVVCGSCGRPCHVNIKRLASGGRTERWICPHRTGPCRDCWGESYRSLVVDELNAWVASHLAPYLASELQALAGESSSASLNNQILKLERELGEMKEVETKRLKMALTALDEEQFAALAQELRFTRQEIEQKLMQAKRLLALQNQSSAANEEILSSDPAKFKAALRRHVRWIAITNSGVTCLTSLGTYLGAEFIERDRSVYGTPANRRTIGAPTSVSTASCLGWIGDPRSFLAGRRESLGAAASRCTDDELLPGGSVNADQEDNAA